MNQQKETKINTILQQLPKNAVATTKWLHVFGVGSDLLNRYKQTKWFTAIGHGAVIRTGDVAHWAGALYAMQTQLQLPIHLGGKSAIGYQGHAHYIPLGKESIMLFCPYKTSVPKWFEKYDWGVDLKIVKTNLFPQNYRTGIRNIDVAGFNIKVASLERAIMETLMFVPDKQTLDEAKKLMEGLNTLRPDIVQQLLENCNSIKTKRLFLLLAERENHPWVKRLKLEKIDLGTGNRMLIKGGVLDKRYHITIPRDWQKDEGYFS